MFSSPVPRMIMGALAGALIGFVYQRFHDCSSGACPFTANPIMSMVWGASIGLMLTA